MTGEVTKPCHFDPFDGWGASETNRVPYLCIAMQHPENAFHAFLGIQPGENMVFLLFERKDVKNLVIALAIFRRRA